MVRAHFRPLVSHQCVFKMFSFGRKCSPENVSSTIAFAYRFYLSTCFRMEMHAKTITKRRVRFQKCSLSSILEKDAFSTSPYSVLKLFSKASVWKTGGNAQKRMRFEKKLQKCDRVSMYRPLKSVFSLREV